MKRFDHVRFGLALGAGSTVITAAAAAAAMAAAGAALSLPGILIALAAGFFASLAVMGLYLVLTRTIYQRAVIEKDAAAALSRNLDDAGSGDLTSAWDDLAIMVNGREQTIRFKAVYDRLVEVLAESDRMSIHLKQLAEEIMDQSVKLSGSAEDQSKSVGDSTAAISRIDDSIHKVVGNVEDLSDMGESVSSATYQMIASIEEVSGNTQALSQAVQEAVSATEEMVGNVRSVAASTQSLSENTLATRRSMEEIQKATSEIRDRAEEAAGVSGTARQGAAEAKDLLSKAVSGIRSMTETMESTHEVMHQLGVHSRAIGEILTVISGVAADTHLLSLNASIMAAKAGEHGRGFSVVASEIKTLALRTTESAKQIERLILDTQESVDRAVRAIEEGKAQVKSNMKLSEQADRALAEVLERVDVAARNAHEIASATMQQAETNVQVFRAVDEVSQRTEQIRKAMREQEESSAYVRERALVNQTLVDQVARAMQEQAQSSRLISSAMEKLTTSIQSIRLAAEDEVKSSAGIVRAIEAILRMADLVTISAQNVSNTSMSVLHHSLLLRSELSGIRLPVRPPRYAMGFLLDSITQERWKRERVLFEQRANELGARCEFRVAEGNHDLQLKQARELCALGVDIMIVVAVDGERAAEIAAAARQARVPIIAYHRMIKSPNLDLFISFDGVKVGRMQAEAALKKITGPDILVLCGSPTDMYAHALKQGQMEVLKPRADRGEIKIVDVLWVEDWLNENAYKMTRRVIETHGPLDGVIASNDGTAGGAIKAIGELIFDRKVAVTGMDTELTACRRIIQGTQTMTVYMPIKLQAWRTVEAALLIIKKEQIPGITNYLENQGGRVPAIFLKPIKIDADNLEEIVVKDGFHTREAVYGKG